MAVQYKIPDYVHVSQDCRHLLSRIFVAHPSRVGIYPLRKSKLLSSTIALTLGNYNVHEMDTQRISIKDIKSHPWFLKKLPRELTETNQAIHYQKDNPSFSSLQSVDEIMKIVSEARKPPPSSRHVPGFGWGGEEDEEEFDEEELEEEEEEDEYEKQVKAVHASGEFHLN